MNARQEDGLSLRAHLEQASSGLFPDKDAVARLENVPDVPTAFNVWAMFSELHLRREYSEAGPQRFSWSTIRDWQQLIGVRLTPWELSALFRIEDVFFIVEAGNKPNKQEKKKQ